MSEQSVASAKASVMVYDNANKTWRPSVSSGLSKVHLYHHSVNNTFRIVGRNINDHEVVINSAIFKGLKYNQATPTFHQWRDTGTVYGLNFTNKDDAENFALAMLRALEILGQSTTNHRSSYQTPFNCQKTGPSGVSLDEYAEYRGCIRTNSENGDRNASTPEYVQYACTTVNHSSHPTTPGSASSPSGYSHHRTSSAPLNQQLLCTVQPPPPLQPSYQVSSPPPPPPPPPAGKISGSITLPRQSQKSTIPQPTTPVSLASALATAKLKKTQTKPGSETGNGDARIPTMASMMDEMTRTLARRRAQAENHHDRESIGSNDSGKAGERMMGNNASPNKHPGAESPQSQRSRGDSTCESDGKNQFVDFAELERVKQDIMVEMKKEINSMKLDIIEVIRMELNRR